MMAKDETPAGFDWEFYLHFYPDLKQNGVNSRNKALRHWLTHGKVEGRIASKEHPIYVKNLSELEENIDKTIRIFSQRIPLQQGDSPLINILTRTNARPNFFRENRNSIRSQKRKKIRHLISYENEKTLAYLTDFKIPQCDLIRVKRKTKTPYFYNLFINDLLNEVHEGWILVLDDDDLFTTDFSLNVITDHLKCEENLIIWKSWQPDKILPDTNDYSEISMGQIASRCFMFHSKHKEFAKWDAFRAADFRCFENLRKKLRPIIVHEILTKVNYTDQFGGFGSLKDKNHHHWLDKAKKTFSSDLRNTITKAVGFGFGGKEKVPPDFDWEFYASYPDLKKNGITTKKKAWHHWRHHGKFEGRYFRHFSIDQLKIEKFQGHYQPQPHTLIYLIDKSINQNISGYTIKSHHTLTLLKKTKFNIYPLVRLDHEFKRISDQTYDDVSYHYLDGEPYHPFCSNEYMQTYYDALFRLCLKLRPSIIHSCSNYVNGIIGALVARTLGIPAIYEIRGLWELSAKAIHPEYATTDFYRLAIHHENMTVKMSNHVLALNHELKNELIRRGNEQRKISVIPFYVISDSPSLCQETEILEERNRESFTKDKLLIGHFGTLNRYEGALDLLKVSARMIQNGIHSFMVMIIGNGAEFSTLKDFIAKEHLEKNVILKKQVSYTEIQAIQKTVDIICLPRKDEEVCNTVLPMKLIDALSVSKCVVVSDVRAMKEIVKEGHNGFLFERGNLQSLYDLLKGLITNKTKVDTINKMQNQYDPNHYLEFMNQLYTRLENK